MAQACLHHPQTESVAGCHSCAATMCSECFKWTIKHRSSCAPCAFEQSTKRTRAFSFGISFFGVGVATLIGFWVKTSQTPKPDESSLEYLIIGALVFLGVSIWLFMRGYRRDQPGDRAR